MLECYMVAHGGTHGKKTIIRNHTVTGRSERSGSSKEKGREAVCVSTKNTKKEVKRTPLSEINLHQRV